MQNHDTNPLDSGQHADPCPFCGSNATAWQADAEDTVYVRCYECHSCGPVRRSPSEAVAVWNSRQPDRLAQIETRLAAWFAAKYPEGVYWYEFMAKFNEEAAEYEGAFRHWEYKDANTIAEAADVCIVLFNTAAHFGHSLGDAILAKLAIIERRLTEPNYGRGAK